MSGCAQSHGWVWKIREELGFTAARHQPPSTARGPGFFLS